MKPALVIFAKTPLPGQVKTRLLPSLSAEQSADLYRCMLLDTISRVSTLRFDTVIFYDGDEQYFRRIAPGTMLVAQQGDDLGSRLENALTSVSSLGYTACCVIGTDAPDLPLSYIEESFKEMGAGSDVVFGPAEDGGYYLVAVKGEYGDLFKEIPWSSADVLQCSVERARSAGLVATLLPTWYDVDNVDDLYRPGLSDPSNGAPLTRHFILDHQIAAIKSAYAGN
jgi:uncharacterized protein